MGEAEKEQERSEQQRREIIRRSGNEAFQRFRDETYQIHLREASWFLGESGTDVSRTGTLPVLVDIGFKRHLS